MFKFDRAGFLIFVLVTDAQLYAIWLDPRSRSRLLESHSRWVNDM